MSMRVEVTEQQWVQGVVEADYVVLDLAVERPRPWLGEAVEIAELVGHLADPDLSDAVDRALELDLDFLSVRSGDGSFDARRLPLRLIVEQRLDEVGDTPELFGAAWARRIEGWSEDDRDTLAALARRERIFLGATHRLPADDWLLAVAPFAVALPDSADAGEAARIRAL